MRSLLAIAVLAAAITVAPVVALTHKYKYDSFCQLPTLNLVGTASKVEFSKIRLNGVNSGADEMGALWHSQSMSDMRTVTATLTFQLHEFYENGGDGFALVLQTESGFALGRDASGLGYDSIDGPGIAVELDLFQNSDIGDHSNHEVSIHYGTTSLASAESASIGHANWNSMRDGNQHHLMVTVDASGSTTTVSVEIDGSAIVSGTINSADTATMALKEKNVYLGVTGSTGGRYASLDMIALSTSWEDGSTGTSQCDEGFTGLDCEPDSTLSRRECPVLSKCLICVTSHFCCGASADGSTCGDVFGGVNGRVTNGGCPEQNQSDDGEKSKQAAIALGVLFGLVTIAFVISSAYWYRRVKRAEDKASMLGDMGEEYSKL